MTEERQKQLLKAVRVCPPVEAPSNFTAQVLSAIRREDSSATTVALFDQLSLWFPRLATAALVIIIVGAAFEFVAIDDLFSQLAQASDQWLLPMDWL